MTTFLGFEACATRTIQIELAHRHVIQGRRILAKQRERIAWDVARAKAKQLLVSFEQSLTIFEDDLAHLFEERGGQ